MAGERGEKDLLLRALRQAVEDPAAVDAEDVGEEAFRRALDYFEEHLADEEE